MSAPSASLVHPIAISRKLGIDTCAHMPAKAYCFAGFLNTRRANSRSIRPASPIDSLRRLRLSSSVELRKISKKHWRRSDRPPADRGVQTNEPRQPPHGSCSVSRRTSEFQSSTLDLQSTGAVFVLD